MAPHDMEPGPQRSGFSPGLRAALERADAEPEGEPFSPEQEAEYARRVEDLRSGRVQGRTTGEIRATVDKIRSAE